MSTSDQEPIISESSKELLLPYYVYILLNPLRDNTPFYVGKGTGQRVGAHNRDVDRLLREQKLEIESSQEQEEEGDEPLDEPSLSEKQKEIIAIKDSGKQPLEVIVGRYKTEEQAFAVEATLMHFMFDHKTLTNIARGHGSRFIRTRADFDEIIRDAREQKDIKLKPGIDEERVKNVRNNEYRDEHLLDLEQAGAYDLLGELQDALTDRHFNWRNFSEPGDKRFHPSESNGYLAVIVRIGPLDFNVQFTQTKIFSVQFIYTKLPEKNPEVQAALNKLESQLDLKLGAPKAGRKYSWFEPYNSYRGIRKMQGPEGLLEKLDQLRAVLEPPKDATH